MVKLLKRLKCRIYRIFGVVVRKDIIRYRLKVVINSESFTAKVCGGETGMIQARSKPVNNPSKVADL